MVEIFVSNSALPNYERTQKDRGNLLVPSNCCSRSIYWLGLSNDWGNSRDVPYWVLPLTAIASPLAFALAARWTVQRNLRGFGFKPGPIRWLLVGWLMPVTVAVAAYGTAAALGFVRLKTDVDLDLLSFAG